MSGNTFGSIFRVTTFGESHGEAVGAVIDGCPAGLVFDIKKIQNALDKRKPGSETPATSTRKEPDRLQVISGVYDGVTTGAPITLTIKNTDANSTPITRGKQNTAYAIGAAAAELREEKAQRA